MIQPAYQVYRSFVDSDIPPISRYFQVYSSCITNAFHEK